MMSSPSIFVNLIRKCVPGAAGADLIFQLKQAKKLVLFDIVEGAVVGSMACPSDDVLVAAGVEKMVLVIPGTKLVHQYSLPELKHTKTATWSEPAAPASRCAGVIRRGH